MLWKFIHLLALAAATQTIFNPEIMQDWSLELCKEWDVLGPFPIHAREQHYLSPSFPLDLTTPYQHEPDRQWFSAYTDGGKVGWSRFNATEGNNLLVSFPHIRWNTLRATEGWAALQHHNVLHTTLKLTPPASGGSQLRAPRLAFSLLRGSFFTLIPEYLTSQNTSYTPEWHPGNIYALPQSPMQLIDPPSLSFTEPTTYHLFVSGDYEIRLFGDPAIAGRQEPVLDIVLNVSLEPRHAAVALDPSLDVSCDFVDGWAFGAALGFGIRANDGWWEVVSVAVTSNVEVPLSLSLLQKQRIAPSQTRIIPVEFDQTGPYHGDAIHIGITLRNKVDLQSMTLMTSLKIRHRLLWNAEEYEALKATYFLAGTPTLFLALPPLKNNLASPKPPILALHGAGVDISEPFWPAALPRQPHSWIVCPAGRTSWGFDWHGPSADDAWGSLGALTHLLASDTRWTKWTIQNDTQVVVIGHSNGGQGTWYLAARYPDRVLAAVPAAAYIKSQQYIPLSLSRGSHFMDPSLRAILDASLTPDDNDLFLSNVIDMNILAIHGGDDENVPTWHSRELVGLVKSWREDANISFAEDPGKPHWYSDVLTSSRVRSFLSSVLEDTTFSSNSSFANRFTLTVATPEDSGPFHGFAIRALAIPGRLGRLYVSETHGSVAVRTTNVHTFSVDLSVQRRDVTVDGIQIPLRQFPATTVWIQRTADSWTVSRNPPLMRRTGALSQILRSRSPLLVVIPAEDRQAYAIASRLAHALLLYFRLDTEIITDAEALSQVGASLHTGETIVVGLNNAYGSEVLRHGPRLVRLYKDGFTVHGKKFDGASLGLLFFQPHPSAPDQRLLFVCGTDGSGLERAARLLLPIRTGVALPEFIIIGRYADSRGAGGLRGAGFWDRNWGWSEAVAWLD